MPLQKYTICPCDEFILTKHCICRLFLNQTEFDDYKETIKYKNEKIENLNGTIILGKSKFKMLNTGDLHKTINYLIKEKYNTLLHMIGGENE